VTGFAIVGFLIGLRFTLEGGNAIDIAYHVSALPVLVITLVALLRVGRGQNPWNHRRTETTTARS